MQAYVSKIQGPRNYQQDAYLITNRGLFAVFDGLGGHANGDLASKRSAEILRDSDTVLEGLINANEELFREKDNRATTAVTLQVFEERVQVHWCGDSRAYCLNGTELTQLTQDHGQGHILYQALGLEQNFGADIKLLDRKKGNTYFLTSDGIHDYVSHEELTKIFIDSLLVEDPAKYITDSIESKTKDNATVIVVTED